MADVLLSGGPEGVCAVVSDNLFMRVWAVPGPMCTCPANAWPILTPALNSEWGTWMLGVSLPVDMDHEASPAWIQTGQDCCGVAHCATYMCMLCAARRLNRDNHALHPPAVISAMTGQVEVSVALQVRCGPACQLHAVLCRAVRM
jgi:hypothetical protein